MSQVVLYASMSVDGFATGPGEDLSVLHGWAFGDDTMAMHPQVTSEFFAAGAVIMGAGTLRAGDAAWGDEEIFPMPVFVPTHRRREPVVRNGALFTFVDSPAEALARATDAAGDRAVYVMGSPDVAWQLPAIGAVDAIEIAITAVLLGDGIRLFDHLEHVPLHLEPTRVLPSARITHVRYRVAPSTGESDG